MNTLQNYILGKWVSGAGNGQPLYNVYAGNTIQVKLTVKEKIAQDKKEPVDIAKGIVKWYVEVYDEIQETVAVATILTMVKKKQQE